ncbi:MAG: hypothetical protein MRZ79_01960 [Bacteroidia bacterium]|nr:hypothetical protein [Bacteroidia bacterium]
MKDIRFLTLFVLIIASCLSTFAQPFEAFIPLENEPGASAEISMFTGASGGLVFVKEGNNGLVLKLDEGLKVEKRFEVFDLPKEETHQRLGFTYKDGLLFIAYLNQETQAYEVLSILSDSEGTNFSSIDMSRLSSGSVFWGTFTYEGILHIVRLPKGQSSIRLCKFEGGQEFSAEEFNIENEQFIERLRDNLTRIDQENPPNMERTYLPGKLYHFDDQLYLTLDEATQTNIVHIDLRTGIKEEFSLPMKAFADSLSKTNSLIIEGKIFQLAMSRDSLNLSIKDISTRNELHTYTYTSTEEWDIQLWKAEKALSDGKIIPFTSHQDFFADVYEMPYLAIGANIQADSMIEFKLGGVNPQITKGVTGIVLDEAYDLAYLPSFIETQKEEFPQALPKLLASNRFGASAFENMPHFKSFFLNGKPYIGYYDKAKGGYYISR